jgi:P-type Cu+ transporter
MMGGLNMASKENTEKTILTIQGMTCAACANRVEKALGKLAGVRSASVNLATEEAVVEHEVSVPVSSLVGTIESAGYQVAANRQRAELRIEGMTCAACANRVEQALAKAPGVSRAAVNLAAELASVEYDANIFSLEDLIKIVEKSGYSAGKLEQQSVAREDSKDEEKLALASRRMWVAWVFTLPAAAWMLAGMLIGGHQHGWPNALAYNIGMLVLALPVVGWAGWNVFVSAWKAVRHGSANMDTLIAMGTFAAMVHRYNWFFGLPIENYAGMAAMIMAFHLTGRYVETKARGRASQAIRKLLELGARTATLLVDGQEKQVSIQEVQAR